MKIGNYKICTWNIYKRRISFFGVLPFELQTKGNIRKIERRTFCGWNERNFLFFSLNNDINKCVNMSEMIIRRGNITTTKKSSGKNKRVKNESDKDNNIVSNNNDNNINSNNNNNNINSNNNNSKRSSKIVMYIKSNKLYLTYNGFLLFFFSIFAYCITKLLIMFFEEPPAVQLVKENVLKDKKLLEEYEEVIFSRFWSGFLNDNDARIIINIKSKKQNKKGRIVSNLIKKNDQWIIKTLTYYNTKKTDNLKTDDLKNLQKNEQKNEQQHEQISLCPINTDSFSKKK
ncbi:conserved Plasmodium protein, unknown function [Plasmodium sp. gorilla clade G2]|uniref:conserved Plasmodium protein, unknown function n=1 Tax=Plasmodium sp. gorilla clade G2 TaxID=880535 RepID=UPI000D2151CC|nr:conserved Plasmodium protein, unknown function [Plasmodium sp. gorilla clade G2]SOV15008.1 conserved Plasmodium protein, unknown function [Plasmodium sp. gorilla clade G2]